MSVPCPRTFHDKNDKNDKNDKVSINLCQSLSWATFQIPCHSCHLCHSAKGNRYIYPLVMNTGSEPTRNWTCQWPIGLYQTATVCGSLLLTPICVTAHVLYLRAWVWFLPTHLVDTCICVRSFPLPVSFCAGHLTTCQHHYSPNKLIGIYSTLGV
jgi:hypothetical protein